MRSLPITGEDLISDFRAALEYLIETKQFTQTPATPWRVMGQKMPMSELAQILHQIAETPLYQLANFDLDVVVHNIRVRRT
jgi:hypothetical protein